MERSGVTSREALALRPGDRIRLPPPIHNPGYELRDDVFTVARVEHSPDYRGITIVTTNDLHFPPWQIERVDE